MSRQVLMAIGMMSTMIFTGCNTGPATGTVSGQVVFDGKPYGEAAVVFFSLTTGGGGTANLASDGSFSLPGKLVVGDYQIYLAPKLAEVTEGDAPPSPVKTDAAVPEKYWSESSTDVTFTVKPGDNKAVIEFKR